MRWAGHAALMIGMGNRRTYKILYGRPEEEISRSRYEGSFKTVLKEIQLVCGVRNALSSLGICVAAVVSLAVCVQLCKDGEFLGQFFRTSALRGVT
jgi:hypothetical protein